MSARPAPISSNGHQWAYQVQEVLCRNVARDQKQRNDAYADEDDGANDGRHPWHIGAAIVAGLGGVARWAFIGVTLCTPRSFLLLAVYSPLHLRGRRAGTGAGCSPGGAPGGTLLMTGLRWFGHSRDGQGRWKWTLLTGGAAGSV